MDRRQFLEGLGLLASIGVLNLSIGCRGRQFAHILNGDDRDMVGSHTAGAETWEPLIQSSVKDENTKKAGAEPPLKEVPTATIGSATAVLPAHVGHALECLATLEKKDPKTVNEAKRFFLLK